MRDTWIKDQGSGMLRGGICDVRNSHIFKIFLNFPSRVPGENHRVPNPAPTPPATPSHVMGPPR